MAEEPLLGRLEGQRAADFACRFNVPECAGDVGGLHRRIQIVVNDGEGLGVGVVDANLLRGKFMLDQLVFDSGEAERSRGVEAERAQVAGQNLHRRNAAALDRLDELGPRGEGEVLAAPQAQSLRIGEIVDRGGAGGRDIDHAGIRKRVLKAQAGAALLRGGDVTALSLAASGVLHRMRLVEDHHSIEVGAQPFDDLFDPRNPFSAVVGA